MEYEFNEFSKDVERRKNEIKVWARLKRELYQLKTDRDFVQAVNKEMIELEKEDKNKPKKIKNLENEFIVSSDRVQDIANEVRNGYLRKTSNENLTDMMDYLVQSGEDLYELALEYSHLTGDEIFTHPNYDKFVEYSNCVLQELDDEINLRR